MVPEIFYPLKAWAVYPYQDTLGPCVSRSFANYWKDSRRVIHRKGTASPPQNGKNRRIQPVADNGQAEERMYWRAVNADYVVALFG